MPRRRDRGASPAMSREIVPSSLGMSRPVDPPARLSAAASSSDGPTPEGPRPETSEAAPAPTGVGTASADDLGLAPDQVRPDPFLAEFQPSPPAAATPS